VNRLSDEKTIQEVLQGWFINTNKRSIALTNKFYEMIGMSVPPTTSADESMKSKMLYMLSCSIAKKLLADDRSDPLYVLEGLDQLLTDYLTAKFVEATKQQKTLDMMLAGLSGNDIFSVMLGTSDKSLLDESDKKQIQDAVKVMLPTINNAISSILGFIDEGDPYDMMWRVVDIISALADEKGLPLSMFYDDNFFDEVTKRLYSREMYIALNEKAFSFAKEPGFMKMFATVPAEDEAEDAEETRQEIQDELDEMAAIQESAIYRTVIELYRGIVNDEIHRLYPE